MVSKLIFMFLVHGSGCRTWRQIWPELFPNALSRHKCWCCHSGRFCSGSHGFCLSQMSTTLFPLLRRGQVRGRQQQRRDSRRSEHAVQLPRQLLRCQPGLLGSSFNDVTLSPYQLMHSKSNSMFIFWSNLKYSLT